MNALGADFPEEPADAEVAEDEGVLRYDDLIQDGRLRLECAWRPTGRALYSIPSVGKILRDFDAGVTTVLSRVALEATDAVLSPRARAKTRVRHRFEHVLSADGSVDRLLFSTWLTAIAVGKDGVEQVAGRAYGQRVLTHLGAPPGKHLVRRLAAFGERGVPEHRALWQPPTGLLELPEGARPLDAAPRLDPARVVFGLSHTDLNQHVNFLMYLRAFEQAAVARFIDLGRSGKIAARSAQIGYRKPSFAGDTVRIALRAYETDGAVGVVAAVVEDGAGPAERATFAEFGSARVVARITLRP
ncbi:MAG TPA: hotdog domain-containing protein [Polyangiaceae bacterium]|nr:hotdog domain-containing protein [Polyangiaceae bacterium]